ncbi:hypothetical protein ES707_19354 [subsurface metagenome]
MNMEWQDKKDVLLKALFDADNKKKIPGLLGVSCERVEEAMSDLGVSLREMHHLSKELEKGGYMRKSLTNFVITLKGKRYVREQWDRRIKGVWEEHKNDKLEKLAKE